MLGATIKTLNPATVPGSLCGKEVALEVEMILGYVGDPNHKCPYKRNEG